MIYENFDLRIDADGEGFVVRARAPRGSCSNEFLLPPVLASGLMGLPAGRLGSGQAKAVPRDAHSQRPLAAEVSPRRKGSLLFTALFGGPVRSLFHSCLAEAEVQPEHGLLIRLRFDLRDGRVRPLLDLPWEVLFDEDAGTFLGLRRRTPIVRCLDVPSPAHALPFSSPLRVLAVIANPSSSPALDLTGEWQNIERAFAGRGHVQLTTLRHATREELRHALREESFHLVHFMGHGSFDPSSGAGALLLESPDRGADPIAAGALAALFSDREHPILVILNACYSARSTAAPDQDPFAGVAAALVLAGLPAVLAMRTAIPDPVAVMITAELYRRLAQQDRLEAAVSEVRLALSTSYEGTAEWAVPALFLREEAAAVHDRPSRASVPEIEEKQRENPGIVIHQTGDVEKQTIVGNVGTLNVN